MKKNICFFIGSFQSGGAENHVLSILQNINLIRYNPHICTFRDSGRFADEFHKLKLPIHNYDLGNRLIKPIKRIFVFYNFVNFLKYLPS